MGEGVDNSKLPRYWYIMRLDKSVLMTVKPPQCLIEIDYTLILGVTGTFTPSMIRIDSEG